MRIYIWKRVLLEYLRNKALLTEDESRNLALAEGTAYSLYCKTSFPKDHDIALRGLPYDLKENAKLFKEIYILSYVIQDQAEEAYVMLQSRSQESDFIDEEAPFIDEPVTPEIEAESSRPVLTPYYQKYSEIETQYPNAVVVTRLGDFYEVMGEKAKLVAEELNLTLTSREVGLPERVPMCGFPYHAAGNYIEKLLETHAVILLDGEEEPKYILSHAEAKSQSEKEKKAQLKPQPSDEPQGEKKGIKDRARKSQRQSTLFDFVDGEAPEMSAEEALKTRAVRDGEASWHGEWIYDYYQTNPTKSEFIKYLKEIKGIGGSYDGNYGWSSDGKGITAELSDKGQKPLKVVIAWTEVAERIADLIDAGKYFSEAGLLNYRKSKLIKKCLAECTPQSIHAEVKKVCETPVWLNQSPETDLMKLYGTGETEIDGGYRLKYNETGLEAAYINPENPNDTLTAQCSWYQASSELLRMLQNGLWSETETEKPTPLPVEANKESKNADLTALGIDQTRTGGAKSRCQGNLAAIRLLKTLERDNASATEEEKKILAGYVGWGGLAEAFDGKNERWQKENTELKSLLTPSEYELAKGSVLNAHYTSREVIDGIYKALLRFGVKGNNRILEPALGTGNFFGYMPQEIANGAKLYGVELDSITGRIAEKLYPKANIQVKGFEETSFSNNYFDIVVGNVPFGGYSVYDSGYARYNFLIHDYFLAKSLDKLKPNGIMAVITSKGTMDKQSPIARKYLADRAELLCAIRLPNTAFKQTANTEAVTDILFFRKREERLESTPENTEWLRIGETSDGYEVNEYFINHPNHILGHITKKRGLYGAESVTVESDGRVLSEAIAEIIETLPSGFYENPEPLAETAESKIETDYNVRELCYKAENGKLYQRLGDEMQEQELPAYPSNAYERIQGMIGLRSDLRRILDMQTKGCTDAELERAQWSLNDRYDRFVKKYGSVNSQVNKRLFRMDGDSALLFACERISKTDGSIEKADIFTKRTIRPYVSVTQTSDCLEALQISRNEHGRVDIEYIECLTGKTFETVIKELGDSVYRNPVEATETDKYSGYETSEEIKQEEKN